MDAVAWNQPMNYFCLDTFFSNLLWFAVVTIPVSNGFSPPMHLLRCPETAKEG